MRLLAVPLVMVCVAGCSVNVEQVTQPAPRPGVTDIAATIILIGDAGEPARDSEPVLVAARREIGEGGAATTVVFLGDNIYPGGMPDTGSADLEESQRRLEAQIELVRSSGARGIIVPGNHDWANGGQDGWEAIRRQERYIRSSAGDRVRLLPEDGCPGPSVVDTGPVRMILLDTQWWLHNGPRPEAGSGCPAETSAATMDSLRDALAGAGSRHTILMAHHPLATGGPHGGHFDWTDHIFPLHRLVGWLWLPLPVIGSLYPLVRGAGVSPQDLPNGRNEAMRDEIEAALREHPPLVYASGHDHNLQVIRRASAPYLLVSGGGFLSRAYPVKPVRGTMFALAEKGFMRLDVLRNGRVRLGVIAVTGEGAREEFSAWLSTQPGKTGSAR